MQRTLMEAIAEAKAAQPEAPPAEARPTGAELDRLEFEERRKFNKRKERWEL